jgi:hypothetical protein
LRLLPKAHRPLLLTGPHRAPAGITLGTLQPERSKNAQDHVRSQLSADRWRAERQDDNGPGEQPGPSLKDPLHVTSPLLQGQAMFRRRRLPVLKGGFCVSTVSMVCTGPRWASKLAPSGLNARTVDIATVVPEPLLPSNVLARDSRSDMRPAL